MAHYQLKPEFRELAAAGQYASQIARKLGINHQTVRIWARDEGIALANGRTGRQEGRAIKPNARSDQMAEMYKQGCTLRIIGTQFGITRERVRQILAKRGVKASEGGASVSVALKKKKLQSAREIRALNDYGLPYDVVCELRSSGLIAAHRNQKQSASIRGIEWHLTFAQRFAIWQTSGKLHLRGRGKGKYVMSRIRDDGPYALGNVHIQLSVENSKEAVRKWKGKVKANRGVYCLYPGRKLAWLARVAKERLGFFETEQEAVDAREAYFEKNPSARRQGRGYAITGTKGSPRYQVMVGGRYVGTYSTPEHAQAARAAYLSSVEPSHA